MKKFIVHFEIFFEKHCNAIPGSMEVKLGEKMSDKEGNIYKVKNEDDAINSDEIPTGVSIESASYMENNHETKDDNFTLENNTHELVKIPAEIWMKNNTQITKVFAFDKEVKQIELDPFLETADTDRNNNYWPVKVEPTKFELYQYKNRRDKSLSLIHI